MNTRWLRELACLLAVCAAAVAGQVRDPGVRPGLPGAGGAVAGVDAEYFAGVRGAFQEVHSIVGDLESGVGLGPRFNGTSCGGCHAYPAPGGSSPPRNPQIRMGSAHGARNVMPEFVRPDGPILAVRVKARAGSIARGEVAPLFTVTGRSDAGKCAVKQLDFSDASNLGFRIPTPLFGAGLIDNIPDAVILANRAAAAVAKRGLGISGEPNLDTDGSVGRFGWKAQHHALMRFAGDAYRTEMGVPNDMSMGERESLNEACSALYETPYDDPNYAESYDVSPDPPVFVFTEFMRFLRPPAAVTEFPGATAESIRDGRRVFERVGCALCHTPSLETGGDSDIPALNRRAALLYSDLLLHHMGPRLADGIVQGRAGPDEFRTAPLWGIGQRVFFLHDGRTTDLVAAIQEHGGEADTVLKRFRELSAAEQHDVLNFLRSL